MDPFIGEIRLFAGNFAPRGWALCQGQILPIQQNAALFSLLGTTYGGNGSTNFALPDLRSLTPMHAGQGPGLSLRDLGEVIDHDTAMTSIPTGITPARGLGATTGTTANVVVPDVEAPYLGMTFIIALEGVFPPRD